MSGHHCFRRPVIDDLNVLSVCDTIGLQDDNLPLTRSLAQRIAKISLMGEDDPVVIKDPRDDSTVIYSVPADKLVQDMTCS
jgi:hypothetical protein